MNRADAIIMLKNLKNSHGASTGYTSGFDECMDRAIQALESIDKIKSEIEDFLDTQEQYDAGLRKALEIIDKHIGDTE